MSCAAIDDARRNPATRIAHQHDLRARVADGRNAAHQSVAGQHRQVFADAVAAAEVNFNRAPPVRRVAQDDAGQFELPRRLLLPADVRAELVVFLEKGGGLQILDFKPLIFEAEIFNFLEQPAAGHDGVHRRAGQLADGIDGSEERREQTAAGGLMRDAAPDGRLNSSHRHQRHRAGRD